MSVYQFAFRALTGGFALGLFIYIVVGISTKYTSEDMSTATNLLALELGNGANGFWSRMRDNNKPVFTAAGDVCAANVFVSSSCDEILVLSRAVL